MADEPGTRPCVACRTPIEIGAAICPTCKSWQKNWKNSVTFYGSYVTAASIMVSAVFFAWNNLTQVFKPANKIEVLDFVFPGGQTYANRGANDVFVSHADIIWGNGQYARVPIEHIVQHGTVYYREETEKEKKLHNVDLPYVWDERGDGSRFLKKARITPDPKTCYGIEIYSQDNSRITQANKYFTDKKVATTYARATLTYYTLSSNSILDNDNMTFNIDFPAELALRDLQNVRCATSR